MNQIYELRASPTLDQIAAKFSLARLSGRMISRFIEMIPAGWTVRADGGSCGAGDGGAGVFQPVLNALLPLARNAWAFGVGILIVVAGLGGLYFILQGTAGAATGGSGLTGRAIIGMVGIIVMVLMAFLLLPQLSCMLQKSAPVAPF
jgi:hypothetical protein